MIIVNDQIKLWKNISFRKRWSKRRTQDKLEKVPRLRFVFKLIRRENERMWSKWKSNCSVHFVQVFSFISRNKPTVWVEFEDDQSELITFFGRRRESERRGGQETGRQTWLSCAGSSKTALQPRPGPQKVIRNRLWFVEDLVLNY